MAGTMVRNRALRGGSRGLCRFATTAHQFRLFLAEQQRRQLGCEEELGFHHGRIVGAAQFAHHIFIVALQPGAEFVEDILLPGAERGGGGVWSVTISGMALV